MRAVYAVLKRCMDVTAVTVGLVVLSPLIGLSALAVWVSLGRPVIFRQKRGGKGGRVFILYKFRTMNNAKDADGELLPDGERLTRVGRLLRRFSLDELLQLWNVLKGDMSIIGPRPLLAEYLERYTPEQARRHEVRPGITGWAQVNGRNAVNWEERFNLDVWYVDNVSLWLDVRIVFLTVWGALKGEGISADGSDTMPVFMGSEPDVDKRKVESEGSES